MTNKDKMLQLVLSDEKLVTIYEYNPNDFRSIEDALNSENPIVVAIAKIIESISKNSDSGTFSQTYLDVFNYLNKNML